MTMKGTRISDCFCFKLPCFRESEQPMLFSTMDSGNKNGIRMTSDQGLYFEETTAKALKREKHHFLPWSTGSTEQPGNGCIR